MKVQRKFTEIQFKKIIKKQQRKKPNEALLSKRNKIMKN